MGEVVWSKAGFECEVEETAGWEVESNDFERVGSTSQCATWERKQVEHQCFRATTGTSLTLVRGAMWAIRGRKRGDMQVIRNQRKLPAGTKKLLAGRLKEMTLNVRSKKAAGWDKETAGWEVERNDVERFRPANQRDHSRPAFGGPKSDNLIKIPC
ncbi:hypothetical protein N7486_002259 [Penicillium sp. IBT 16267x]|nr:hypothetical protein N7486_002259 [Penicillium sp. IBT 16267x]